MKSPYELMLINNKGWQHGASSQALDPEFEQSSDKSVSTVYVEGWVMGKADRQRHNTYSAAKFGITLHEIKPQ